MVIDLDGFAIGPREWDLAMTAIYYDSFGWHTGEEYQDFVRVYGYDIMTWPGYPAMRAVREFLMVTWVIQKAPESEQAAAEATKRIAALRTGASRKTGSPTRLRSSRDSVGDENGWCVRCPPTPVCLGSMRPSTRLALESLPFGRPPVASRTRVSVS